METEDGLETAANEFKGTLFDTGFNAPDRPVQVGTVTIEGIVLHISVYPTRVSRKGNLVHDIRLHYPPREGGRLARIA